MVSYSKIIGYVFLFGGLACYSGLFVATLLTLICIHFTNGYEDLRNLIRVAKRDLIGIRFYFTRLVPTIMRHKDKSSVQIFLQTANRFPNKKAIIEAETGECLTFREAQLFINKLGHVFAKAGYQAGDNVALFMTNDRRYIPIWMGLNQIGVSVALINTNLHGKSLEHSLTVVHLKAIICEESLLQALSNVGFTEKPDIELYTINKGTTIVGKDLNALIDAETSEEAARNHVFNSSDSVLYIYTSGSTGPPKAANMANRKQNMVAGLFSSIYPTGSEDVVYNCLPLYHSSGSILSTCSLFYKGSTMVIRKKFSASNFLSDCERYSVTSVGYIGEMWCGCGRTTCQREGQETQDQINRRERFTSNIVPYRTREVRYRANS